MVLDDAQNERFFDVMDALLYYVNDRFRVVEGFTLDFASPIDDVKCSLVAHALWENVAIIDDFVRDNPYRLDSRSLAIASSWKSALPGLFTLVRYQSGRALLMNEAGVFSVCGVTYELEQEIGPAPAYVEMVLLPFEGLIVYDGFLQAYDADKAPAEVQRIQDEFENRCARGIALTADDFIRQADAYLEAQRDKEFEALLADVTREAQSDAEELPEGFHRGALAGLSPDGRRKAVSDHLSLVAPSAIPDEKEFDRRARRREPVRTLEECLMLLTKADLDVIAQVLGMGSLARLRKAEMVAELLAELPNCPEALESRLLIAGDGDYALACRLARGEVVHYGVHERARYASMWSMEPYVFIFHGVTGYTALIPDELKPAFEAIDFSAIDRIRRQQKQAMNCIDACVLLCGVAAVDDVYDQYRALVSDVLDREEFDALIEAEAYHSDAAFETWVYTPTEYLVHYTLTPDFVAREYTRAQRGPIGDLMRNAATGELSSLPFQQAMGRIKADLATELERLEQYKRDLVESQSNLPMKPLSRTLLENDVFDELLDDENVVRLRAFLDERVPDGQDDYTFADRVVEEIVLGSIESGSLHEVFSYALGMGLEHCSADQERLTLLITNVFNSMPSWENNGWSPKELYEQVTGRKMFYNEDGTVMKVGADDPCPCGSGKKYRDCCGR